MKNGQILTITLDYDKNIYVSPNRGTVNLTIDLNSSTKHEVDEDLHRTLIETRDLQWNKKKAAPGYKNKRVRWYLLLDAFMKDYSDTHFLEQGTRIIALLKKARIKDNVTANNTAIDSGMHETSAASEDLDHLLENATLDESSDDIDHVLESANLKPPAGIYGAKQPRADWMIEQNFQTTWRGSQTARD
jgi:hypothetical protein